jgi:hypothetical protein
MHFARGDLKALPTGDRRSGALCGLNLAALIRRLERPCGAFSIFASVYVGSRTRLADEFARQAPKTGRSAPELMAYPPSASPHSRALIYFVDSRRLMSANYGCKVYCVRPRTEARRKVAMPTYFFDLIKGNELVEDDQGEDFADIEAAKLEGLASARELLADAAKKGILATSPVYLIRNAAGDILATIPFKDALKPD